MASPSERILVTGAAGFTGPPLVARLRAEGRTVLCLSRRAGGPDHVVADMLDAQALRQAIEAARADVVIHLAAMKTREPGRLDEMRAVNVEGTANLVTAMAKASHRPRLVILASTGMVYRAPGDATPIHEEMALGPQDDYARSKLDAEEAARAVPDAPPLLITRPFNYTGPGQSEDLVVPKMVQHIRARAAEIRIGDLGIAKDFSGIDRVVEAYARLATRDIGPGVVNIASGRATTLAAILETLEALSGHGIKRVPDDRYFRKDEPRQVVGCPKRLEQLVDRLPRTDIHELLKSMLAASA